MRRFEWSSGCQRGQCVGQRWQQQQQLACTTSRVTTTLLLFVLTIVLPNDQLANIIRDVSWQHPTRTALAEAMFGSWHQCNSQSIYSGLYGAELVANLTEWR